MYISGLSSNNNGFQYKNIYKYSTNFKGQLENDYFEASKTGNIQKQLKSISNYKFDPEFTFPTR